MLAWLLTVCVRRPVMCHTVYKFTFHSPNTVVLSRVRYRNMKLAGEALEQVKQ
jgi:hypothetical protein